MEPGELPNKLFDFQKALIEWALRRGRAGVFADTGLGKTPMQLVWAQKIIEKTNKPVLLLTPLAVGAQTMNEAKKFDIEAERAPEGKFTGKKVIISNYERLHYFTPDDFGGVVCDESSAIKSFDGQRRKEVTEFMRTVPYRSLWTATAAPNDYIELGTSSEALGELGQIDMLNRFFKNDQNNSNMKRERRNGGKDGNWRFKGYAEEAFWRWVCSWARACRMPSDLGFDNSKFILPPLIEREHIVETRTPTDGCLFAMPAKNFREERAERRRTIQERCELATQLVNDKKQAVVWCHLNDEGDLLSEMISDSVQVSGQTTEEEKEDAYIGFADGSIRVLVIKPKIGAWGMNWQHCNHVVTFASHSYEQYYQAVRRCWRFGQKKPVTVELIASEGEIGVKENMKRKSLAADRMFTSLVNQMKNVMKINRGVNFTKKEEVPAWL
jgi:superfamily II DNA or RNA helicase